MSTTGFCTVLEANLGLVGCRRVYSRARSSLSRAIVWVRVVMKRGLRTITCTCPKATVSETHFSSLVDVIPREYDLWVSLIFLPYIQRPEHYLAFSRGSVNVCWDEHMNEWKNEILLLEGFLSLPFLNHGPTDVWRLEQSSVRRNECCWLFSSHNDPFSAVSWEDTWSWLSHGGM